MVLEFRECVEFAEFSDLLKRPGLQTTLRILQATCKKSIWLALPPACSFVPMPVGAENERSALTRSGPFVSRCLVFANTALAHLLCASLLFCGVASASDTLHKRLHSTSRGSAHVCLVCSLIKGEVGAVEATVAVLLAGMALVFSALPLRSCVLPRTEHRLSPSRAPPLSSELIDA